MSSANFSDALHASAGLLAAKDAEIERLRAELEKHRWIPVGERLPEDQDADVELFKRMPGRRPEVVIIPVRSMSLFPPGWYTHWRYINPPNDAPAEGK